ncbi:glycosyltransferase family 2 protein [Lentzea sp. NEAU-D13]|uniref:Glycosyltransferase family 2 protein n=1 Tax=Lentzea alba TaxID=2714351 RepID=A0A7C9VQ35_9PSEU|nr:glycosyltransferase family 2 protein [Lentzea alba]NGY61654.1 glycosyltransferase family 2 protein [Lentzea alba]
MTDQTRRPLVSIVVPAYDEAPNVKGTVSLFRQIKESQPDVDFELVLIDDGSSDGTADLFIAELGEQDVARVASFSRNFGSHAGLSAGFALCRGDCALTLSADLQEPVEVIDRFLAEWRAGNDIVWAVRAVRSVPKGLANKLALKFNDFFAKHSDVPETFPKEGPSQMLVSRPVLDVVNQMPELNRNILALVAWAGFKQTTVAFEQKPRAADDSKWTTSKKIKLVFDSFVEFSVMPIMLMMVAGVAFTGVGLATIFGFLLGALITLSAPNAIGIIVGVVLFAAGANLGCTAMLGQYLYRAGDDARRRPLYVIRQVRDVNALAGQPPQGVVNVNPLDIPGLTNVNGLGRP